MCPRNYDIWKVVSSGIVCCIVRVHCCISVGCRRDGHTSSRTSSTSASSRTGTVGIETQALNVSFCYRDTAVSTGS